MAHRATVIVHGVAVVAAESTTRDGIRAMLSSSVPTLQLLSNTTGLSVVSSDLSLEIEEAERCRARPVGWYYEGDTMQPDPALLSNLPEVDVYLADGGIRRVRFAGSDGMRAVCIDAGGAFKLALSRTKRIVVYSGPHTCFEDKVTGCLITRTDDGTTRNYGPLSARPNPSINLSQLVADLGLDLERLPVRLPDDAQTCSESETRAAAPIDGERRKTMDLPSLMEVECPPPTIDLTGL